jgi:hypothetical protein
MALSERLMILTAVAAASEAATAAAAAAAGMRSTWRVVDAMEE